jgi:hypothetical protein
MSSTAETNKAFDVFRQSLGRRPRLPPEKLIANADETKLMTKEDGLREWTDGNAEASTALPCPAPLIESSDFAGRSLWVIRIADVVHATENCPFGKSLASGVIKHTNLTGGAEAYSGGELILLNQSTSGQWAIRPVWSKDRVRAARRRKGVRRLWV